MLDFERLKREIETLTGELQALDAKLKALEIEAGREWCVTLIWHRHTQLSAGRQELVNRLFVAQEIYAHREELAARTPPSPDVSSEDASRPEPR